MNDMLRKKILEKCGNFTRFCALVDCSRSGLHRILNGERKGNAEFWFKTKKVLNIPDKDIWWYMGMEERKEIKECKNLNN